MAIVTKTVEVEKAEDKVRKDSGVVTPGTPAYSFQAIDKYEGDPKKLVVEVLDTYFKNDISAFNDFLVESMNRKLRIDNRPGLSPQDKLIAKLAKDLGLSAEDVKAKLGI
jgi:hypothetical protein